MKALILAAGLGTRLAPLTNDRPKSLVEVNKKPILFKQIDNLLEHDITDITIISGYKSEVLKEFVNSNYSNINIINSDDYMNTNNMYSAFLGSKHLYGEEFLMMNADVYYDSSVLDELLKDDYKDAIVTDVGRYIEESMKVIKTDKIVSISKKIPEELAYGSSIDVYKFSKEGGIAFFNKCSEYIEKKHELKMWSEVALNDILNYTNFMPCPLKGRWFEIDNLEDLKQAEILFKEKSLIKNN